MPESHDPLRSAFHTAASAGQSATTLPPVSLIEQHGERVRRRRIAGIAAACCLLLGGSGAALAAFLPQDSGRPTLPATTPSPVAPSGLPTWGRIAIGVLAEAAFFAYVFVLGRAAYRRGLTGDADDSLLEDKVATAA